MLLLWEGDIHLVVVWDNGASDNDDDLSHGDEEVLLTMLVMLSCH